MMTVLDFQNFLCRFQVPTPLPESRRRFLAIKWLITAARDQSGPRDAKMYNKLDKELIDAYNNEVRLLKFIKIF